MEDFRKTKAYHAARHEITLRRIARKKARAAVTEPRFPRAPRVWAAQRYWAIWIDLDMPTHESMFVSRHSSLRAAQRQLVTIQRAFGCAGTVIDTWMPFKPH